ncbi:hypothetical protein G6F22_009211 [Rhizopus arrhizus]|nr:hypothetical protein G6F22_009211 [Rhizopus arrhizus]
MIVAKSLEFVSTAEQRELEYKDQLSALRQENERLLRQANGKKNESRTRNSSKKRQLSNSPNHKKIKSADSLEENPRKKKKKEETTRRSSAGSNKTVLQPTLQTDDPTPNVREEQGILLEQSSTLTSFHQEQDPYGYNIFNNAFSSSIQQQQQQPSNAVTFNGKF